VAQHPATCNTAGCSHYCFCITKWASFTLHETQSLHTPLSDTMPHTAWVPALTSSRSAGVHDVPCKAMLPCQAIGTKPACHSPHHIVRVPRLQYTGNAHTKHSHTTTTEYNVVQNQMPLRKHMTQTCLRRMPLQACMQKQCMLITHGPSTPVCAELQCHTNSRPLQLHNTARATAKLW
jgi:hypothetical protein